MISSEEFKRPQHLPFPKVWHEYTWTSPEGKPERYIIQDITEDRKEEIIKIMSEFAQEEAVTKSLKIHEDPLIFEGVKVYYEEILNGKTALMCLVDEPNVERSKLKIAGCLMTTVKFKDENFEMPPEYKNTNAYYSMAMMKEALDRANIWERYNTDKYVIAGGLYVRPDFRGRGIAPELLVARIKLTKAFGIKVTANTFSSIAAQKSAARAGYQELVEVQFDELSKLFNVPLPGLEGKSTKVMAALAN